MIVIFCSGVRRQLQFNPDAQDVADNDADAEEVQEAPAPRERLLVRLPINTGKRKTSASATPAKHQSTRGRRGGGRSNNCGGGCAVNARGCGRAGLNVTENTETSNNSATRPRRGRSRGQPVPDTGSVTDSYAYPVPTFTAVVVDGDKNTGGTPEKKVM